MTEQEGFKSYVGRIIRTTFKETGTLAHVLHRVTGVGLTVYIFLHIGTMSLARVNGQSFEQVMQIFQQPAFLIADWIILLGALIHGFNGLRITLFNLGIGVRRQKAIFWIAMLSAGLVAVLALYIILPEILGGH